MRSPGPERRAASAAREALVARQPGVDQAACDRVGRRERQLALAARGPLDLLPLEPAHLDELVVPRGGVAAYGERAEAQHQRAREGPGLRGEVRDRKSTRLNSSHT